MSDHKYTNELINETSPYLLQHAHNPVNWHGWNEASLQKAKQQDKPILVSIGYSACHWCHVMEKESFEDEATAAIMNENFINIKIDREERPDIDQVYMDAVQAITGSGGWPLNVFLTPDLKPFYGGTYFPPAQAYNRSSWKNVLLSIAHAFKEKREEVIAQSNNLTTHLISINNFGDNNAAVFNNETLNSINENLLKLSDKTWGGFGNAPKFPQTFSIIYLLRHYHFTKNEASLKAALLSLDKMMMGGIYDHIGGGFSRYSTDERWQIPHFEKMLYDNALLMDAYAEAYQITGKNEYAKLIEQIIDFIQSDMTSAEGGFYSAFDADSEGVEGKFYVWNKHEIDELLGENSEAFCLAYNITETGNWEHTNIIWLPENLENIAAGIGIDKEELDKQLETCKSILQKEREKRTKPGLDNKILCGWNALMVSALCNAYGALSNNRYINLAKSNILFIEKYLFDGNNNLLHAWNKMQNPQPAFLDDYASLIRAYISLFQQTNETEFLQKAKVLTTIVIEKFSDDEHILFYYTSMHQKDILLRKIEVYDGATPSANALMAGNLMQLAIYFDVAAWKIRSEKMTMKIGKLAEKYPTTFGYWILNILQLIKGSTEIVVTGKDYSSIFNSIRKEYIPFKVLQGAPEMDSNWPLLRDKKSQPNQTNIYICENYQCQQPFSSYEEFKNQLFQHF